MPGYVEAFSKLRKRPPGLHRLVPWRQMLDETRGIMSTKDEGYLCCAVIEPPDLGSLSEDEQWAHALRENAVWKLLTPGSGVWRHLRHRPAPPLPPRQCSNAVAQVVDEERRAELNTPGAYWASTSYVGLYHREPKTAKASGFSRYFMTGAPANGSRYTVHDFASETDEILARLATICPHVTRLVENPLLTYLHSCVSVHEHPLWADELGMDLNILMSDCGFWRGFVPVIGDAMRQQYVRSICLYRQFPNGTDPAMFRALNQLPFAFDKVDRWLPKSRMQSQQRTDKLQVNWLSKQKGLRAYWYEARTGNKPDIPNTFLMKQATDADVARDRVLSGEYDLGKLTVTFVVKDDVGLVVDKPFYLMTPEERVLDMARVNGWIGELANTIRATGCTVTDDPINQMENFVATWPGAAYANLDSWEMTSQNFATMALSHGPWKGIEFNEHLQSPPLIYAKTEGCHRIGVDTYVGDLGDAVFVGPKGSGKSTLLAALDVAWMVDTRRHLAHFDVGGSSECVIRCLGGQYHDLSRDVSLQVMADLDDPTARPWIFGWLQRRVEAAGVPRSALVMQYIWGAMRQLWESDEPRTLTRLRLKMADATRYHEEMLQSHGDGPGRSALVDLGGQIKAALQPFVQGGAYGQLVDAPVDRLQLGHVHGFELESLLQMTEVYSAVLEIIFFRLKARRDGSPTRYVFDEAWHYLNTPVWIDILKEDMPAWRRENTSGFFATQSLSQFQDSPLTPLLMESAQTRFLLPNPKALDASVREAYLGLELGEEEIRRNIVMAEPKAEAYWTIPDDRLGRPQRRLINVRLGRIAQTMCGANTKEDRAAIAEIVAKYPAEEFTIHWLRHQGLPDAAREVEKWLKAA